MKKNLPILLSLMLAFYTYCVNAQVKPDDLTHEIHFYDFEDGTADDFIGDAHGTLQGSADIKNGVLDLTNTETYNGYMQVLGNKININTFPALSVEAWGTPSTAANNGRALMMWAFGTYGNPGLRYLFFTPARWGTGVVAKQSVGGTEPWANEDGIDFSDATVGDSTLHHYVVTRIDSFIYLYVNGELAAGDTMAGKFRIDSIANDVLLIGRSVYSADSAWKGTVDLFTIWNTALSADEIKWLYDQGSKRGVPEPSGIEDKMNFENQVNFYITDNRLFARNASQANKLSVIIYNISGSVVYQNNLFKNGEYLKLDQGIYIIKSQHLNNSSVQKIVIR
ncbi:MAG: T9SS type A sorting domain-containing protein [Bacteroidales bacterium]|nr:T9SS type A sorting domain-containing protein [Bacteroidales bacterium]